MAQQSGFDGILEALHAAALDDSLWPRASGRIDEACGTRGNTIIVARRFAEADADILCASSCEHGQRRKGWPGNYFRNCWPTDERVARLAMLEDSRLVWTDDLFTDSERKTSPTYNEWMPLGGYQKAVYTRLDGPDGASIYWSAAEATGRGGLRSDQVETIKAMLPHLRHCVATHYALCSSRSLGRSLTGLLDTAAGPGVIQLDRRGQIVEMNDRARDTLNERQGLFAEKRHLYARLPADDLRLRQLIASALPGRTAAPISGTMAVLRSPHRMRLVVHVLPVTQRGTFGGNVAALVVVREPGGVPRVDADYVAAALGLTRGESRVAVALAKGRTVGEISYDTGREVSTARFHVKRSLAKLGLTRQADLIRLVLSLGEAPPVWPPGWTQ